MVRCFAKHDTVQTSPRALILLAGGLACLWLNSCAPTTTPQKAHVAFTEREDYPKTSLFWRDVKLYDTVDADDTHIKINTKIQRGFLMAGDQIVIDYPICSGRKTHPTPGGLYKILEKKEDKESNRYGRIYDAEGKLVNGDADILMDDVPEGGEFKGAPMAFWMRLTNDGIGHHIGPVKRYPASHGCIRGPRKVVPLVFAKVDKGTKVIVDHTRKPKKQLEIAPRPAPRKKPADVIPTPAEVTTTDPEPTAIP